MPRRASMLIAVLATCCAPAAGQPAQVPGAGPAAPAPPGSPSMLNPPPKGPPTEIYGENLEAWIKKLEHRDPYGRTLAIRTIPQFGEPARKAIPKIIELMGDRDHSVRIAALEVVTTTSIEDEKQRDRIVQKIHESMINNEHSVIRLSASRACARIGFPAARCIQVLTGEHHAKNGLSFEHRKAAAEALGMVGQPNPKDPNANGPDRRAIVACVNLLTDPCLQVRIEAAQSLLYLGVPAAEKDLVDEVRILLQRIETEQDLVLTMWLRVCVMRLDPKQITEKNLQPISSKLSAKEHRVRINAAEALAVMGPAAKSKAADLRAGLEAKDSEKPEDLEFLAKCLMAMAYIGKDASFLKPDVEPLRTHKNEQIRQIAAKTIDMLNGLTPDKK